MENNELYLAQCKIFERVAKRLVFSTPAPNNQDSVVPNDKINFTRYNKNPILLKEHRWGSDPVGRMTDIKLLNGEWSGVPVFHRKTQESREAADMYEANALNAASIGGFAHWKRHPVTQEIITDSQGNKTAEEFDLYEISLTGIPANEDAVGKEAFSTKFYDEKELQKIDASIITLSSKFNFTTMPENKPTGQQNTTTDDNKDKTTLGADQGGNDSASATTNATKGADDLPGVIKDIIKNGGHVTFGAGTPTAAAAAPAVKPTAEPDSTDGDENTGDPNPNPIGMAGKKALSAKRQYDRSLKKSNELVEALKAKKEKAEKDDATDEDKENYTAAHTETLAALKACEEARTTYEAAQLEADDEEAEYATKKPGKPGAKKAGFSATKGEPVNTGASQAGATTGGAPQLKTPDQLAADMKIIAAPSFKAAVGKESQGVTFTKLNALNAKEEDKKIVATMFNTDKTKTVDLRSHAIVANAIMNDPRLRPVVNVARFNTCSSDHQIRDMRRAFNPNQKTGIGLREVANELNSGRIMFRAKDGSDKDLAMFNSTDNALASPSVTTIEWMALALYELFPSVSWKAPIPLFEAQMTGRNTGIIFANVTANPAIYKGNSPAPAADYTYTDTAVALALTPYYLQPMLWNPLYMHQLRYDQQATGWAQGFAKWNSVMDDNLIYTLASTVPAASIIGTSGLSGYNQQPQIFNIPTSGPGNTFYWNNAFNGNLFNPTLNDIIAIEQVYRNQNFDLERETACLVLDPIGERYIAQDPETKNLLSRFVTANGEELLKYKHTMLNVRSRVAVYDPATGQVKDINAGIPATAVSAMLSFIPSQVGIGIGKMDVFMIMDPTNYGQRMSADIRIGAVPLHFTFRGTGLYIPQGANV